MKATYPTKKYGVNILGNYETAFKLADEYGAQFIQIDSVCGHLPPKMDTVYADELKVLRKSSRALVFGGVRFKYQDVSDMMWNGHLLQTKTFVGIPFG